MGNMLDGLNGLFAKVSAYLPEVLPLLLGLGSLLTGLGGFCNEFATAGKLGGLAAMFLVAKGVASDPNTALIVFGLTALGLHANHAATAAKLAAKQDKAPGA